MRALLIAVLLSFISVCYGHYTCPQHQHKQGYFFTKMDGRYYPDYQYARVGMNTCYHPTCCEEQKLNRARCADKRLHHKHHKHHRHHRADAAGVHGFYRCYTCKGYSMEFYNF